MRRLVSLILASKKELGCDLLHPAQELDGRPGLLGHVVAQLDVLALHREGQRDGP